LEASSISCFPGITKTFLCFFHKAQLLFFSEALSLLKSKIEAIKSRQIHVCHISTTFLHRAGGMRRLFSRLRAMIGAGYKVSLIVGRDYEPDPNWNMTGLTVYRIQSMEKYISPIKDIQAFIRLSNLVRDISPDVVHTHLAKAGILGRWAAYINRVPLILHTVHGPTFASTMSVPKKLFYRLVERLTGRITSHFISVGEDIRNAYIRAKVCNENNSTVIYTGRPDEEIDDINNMSSRKLLNTRESFFDTNSAFVVVCVGRLVASKQQDHAIRIIDELRRRNIDGKLIIVGDAFLREEKFWAQYMRKLVADLDLEEHVSFSGHRKDVLEIMAACDAVLHVSKYEGLPNILVEAGLVSKPIVCYLVSGAREIIEDGHTGYIVDQGGIESAVEKLSYLALHPVEAYKMGILAKKNLKEVHRESFMNAKKLAVYAELFKSLPVDRENLNVAV